MAHLPISNNSLNLFFNPFNRLECLGVTVRCISEDIDPTEMSFQVELTCTSDDEDAVEFCAMPKVKLASRARESLIDFNYVLDSDKICPRVMENVRVVKFVANRYLILYGCTESETGHEEGAWILGFQSNFNESLKYLNESLQVLKNSSSKLENFLFHNVSRTSSLKTVECGCHYDQPDPCEFFTQCRLEGGNSDDYEYYYVDEEYEA